MESIIIFCIFLSFCIYLIYCNSKLEKKITMLSIKKIEIPQKDPKRDAPKILFNEHVEKIIKKLYSMGFNSENSIVYKYFFTIPSSNEAFCLFDGCSSFIGVVNIKTKVCQLINIMEVLPELFNNDNEENKKTADIVSIEEFKKRDVKND